MRIWIFGDSFSSNLTLDSKLTWIKDYTNHIGYEPKTYGDIMSDVLNYDVINCAKSGNSNYDIFSCFLNYIEDIKKDDIIIIQFTSVYRFRLVNKNDDFESISAGWDYLYNHFNESDLTIQEVGVNRMSKKYLIEIDDWIKVIKLLLPNNQLLFWTPFVESTGNPNILPLFNFTHIAEETNYKIKDSHYGELGHQELANYFLKILNNEKKMF